MNNQIRVLGLIVLGILLSWAGGIVHAQTLNAPSNLIVTSVEQKTVSLSWTDSSNETGYRLERSSNGGSSWAEVAQLAANTISTTNSGLTCMTSYQYRIRGYRSSDSSYSSYSNVVTATTKACSDPFAPTNLIVSVSGSIANLSWTDNSTNEQAFVIERSDDGGTSWSAVGSRTTNFTNYSDNTLACYSSYSFRVYAYRFIAGVGTFISLYSNVVGVTTGACTPLVAPVIQSYELGELWWVDSNPNNTDTYIERSSDTGSTWTVVGETQGAANTFIDSTFTCGMNFIYRVRAYRASDSSYSPYSTVSGVTGYDCATALAEEICTFTPIFSVDSNYSPIDVASIVKISGDGSRAFVREGGLIGLYSEAVTLSVWDIATATQIGVLTDNANSFDVSDDGKRAAFYSTSSGQVQLWEDDGTLSDITSDPETAENYEWVSMDGSGTKVAFVATNYDELSESLYLWEEGLGVQEIVPNLNSAYTAEISEDGNSVVFASKGNLTNEDPSNLGMIYRWNKLTGLESLGRPAEMGGSELYVDFISLDEDASHIAFRQFSNSVFTLYTWTEAAGFDKLLDETINLDDSIRTDVSIGGWSENGERLFFTSPFDLTGENPDSAVIPYSKDTYEYFFYEHGGFRQVTSNVNLWGSAYMLAISDDGTRILAFTNIPFPTSPEADALGELYLALGTCEAPAFSLVAPTNIVLDAMTSSRLDILWTDKATNETNYRIERSDDGGNTWIALAEIGANSTSYSDTSLTCNQYYRYRVAAFNNTENFLSAWLTSVNSVVQCAPTNLSVTMVTSSTVSLSWDNPVGFVSNAYVERSGDGGSTWQQVGELNVGSLSSFTDTALICGTNYQYRLRFYASSEAVYSDYSSVITASTEDCESITEATCTMQQFDTSHHTGWTMGPVYLSADGSRLAMNYQNNSMSSQGLYLYDVASETLLATIPIAQEPDIDANGTHLVFLSEGNHTGQNADGNQEIFLWSNGSFTQLTQTTGDVALHAPKISSDGTKVAFFGDGSIIGQSSTKTFLFLWDVTNGLRQVLEVNQVNESDFSGDGSTMVFVHYNSAASAYQLSRWDAVNGLRLIQNLSGYTYFYPFSFAVNEDASRVTFATTSDFLGLNTDTSLEIYLWDAVDGLQQLTEGNEFDVASTLAIDASGQRILLVTNLDVDSDSSYPISNGYYFFDEGYGFSQLTYATDLGWPTFGTALSADGLTMAMIMPVGWDYMDDPYPYLEVFIASCTAANHLPAPTNLTVTLSGGDDMNLSWTDNALGENEYRVERSADGTNWTEIQQLANNSTSHSDTSLACGDYHYRVRAYRASDNHYSDYSNIDTESRVCSLPAPSGLNITGTMVDSVSLAWTNNASNASSLSLERSSNGGTTWTVIQALAASATSYSNTGLTCNSGYQYRIRAYRTSDSQYSVYSNVVTGTTTACPPPSAPTLLNVTGTSQTSITLGWTDNASDETNYRLERSASGANSWTEIVQPAANSTSYPNTGLTCNTSYDYRIRAYRAGDGQFSAYSNIVTGTTSICVTLNAPTNIQLSSNTQTGLTLSWTDNSTNESGYEIERSLNGTSWTLLSSLPANATTYTHGGLNCSTGYYYRIRSNHLGTGTYSPYGTTGILSTASCPALVAPVLSSTVTTFDSIRLTWTADGTATSFTLSYHDGTAWIQLGTYNGSPTYYTHNGLVCGTSYAHQVTVYRSLDNSTVTSASFSASTALCPVLDAPAAPVVLNAEPALISLQMPALPNTATSMRLERSVDGTSWTNLGNVTTNYLDNALVCGSSYQYRLVAVRSVDGVTSTSSPTIAFTDACPIPTVLGIYRNGLWTFVGSNDTANPVNTFSFGDSTWQPLVGDWDGDGVDGVGMYRNGQFVLKNEASVESLENTYVFGNAEAGWQAIVGDWNGDGTDSIGLYKDGLFLLSDDNLTIQYRFNTGNAEAGWQAVAGDWDGNGADGLALYKDGYWFLVNDVSNPTTSSQTLSYGPNQGGWLAIVGDWNGDGLDSIGLYKDGLWRMRVNGINDMSETSINFGQAGDIPLAIYDN